MRASLYENYVTSKVFIFKSYIIYIYIYIYIYINKQDMALTNLLGLIFCLAQSTNICVQKINSNT